MLVRLRRAIGRRLVRPAIKKHHAVPFLPPDPVIVEAGAHAGYDTVELARQWPDGTVHAFEPIPALYDQLVKRTRRLPNVHTYRSAIGATNGTVPMWVSEGGDESSSVLAPKGHLEAYPEVTFNDRQDVSSTTLDAWAQREGIGRVDFMWLDMQGHELAMLKHAPNVVSGVRAIVLEVFAVELYEGAPLWPEVQAWLTDEGFEIERGGLGPTMGNMLVVRQ